METINDRFKIIVDRWYNGNMLAFAKSMGKFSSSVNRIITGSANPKASTLKQVCDAIPELSPAWLLLGEMPMLRGGKNTEESVSVASDKRLCDDLIKSKDEVIKAKDELISTLKQYVEDLRAKK